MVFPPVDEIRPPVENFSTGGKPPANGVLSAHARIARSRNRRARPARLLPRRTRRRFRPRRVESFGRRTVRRFLLPANPGPCRPRPEPTRKICRFRTLRRVLPAGASAHDRTPARRIRPPLRSPCPRHPAARRRPFHRVFRSPQIRPHPPDPEPRPRAETPRPRTAGNLALRFRPAPCRPLPFPQTPSARPILPRRRRQHLRRRGPVVRPPPPPPEIKLPFSPGVRRAAAVSPRRPSPGNPQSGNVSRFRENELPPPPRRNRPQPRKPARLRSDRPALPPLQNPHPPRSRRPTLDPSVRILPNEFAGAFPRRRIGRTPPYSSSSGKPAS